MSESNDLEDEILEAVAEMDAPSFDELADRVDVPDDVLDEALAELQTDREIRFHGRQSGWLLE